MITHFTACSRDYFYPRPYRPVCFSQDTALKQSTGEATEHTYLINRWPAPGFQRETRYVNAVVQRAEGPLMIVNLTEVAPVPASLVLGHFGRAC